MPEIKSLPISDLITLPTNAVTQTLACIGRKGAGKTYLAQLLAEKMLDMQAQVVVIDPVGNWWGLRVAADGKSKGKDIFIAGGERGDVPVLPESGARFARLVIEKNVSLVLDVSGFRQNERKRFAADFAEEFFHLKKTQRSAVHLFVEEAQLFVPQRCGPDEARMLGAFENIIRLGRNYGVGCTLISQRPQSVNKEVLSQVECLCVLQVNGAHERKALEEWVQEAGADRKLVGELPGLARGEGYVWSPSWLRTFRRVHFSKKTTFDASATPEVGKATRAALLTQIDVEALKQDLQSVIASAEKDDPKALRRRIAELERERQAKQPALTLPTSVKPDPEAVRAIVMQEMEVFYQTAQKKIGIEIAERLEGIVAGQQKSLDYLTKFAAIMRDPAQWKPQALTTESEKALRKVSLVPTLARVTVMPLPRLSQPSLVSRAVRIAEAGTESNGNSNLRAGARRMLACLCQWSPSGRTESQVAAQVQMKKTGGTWAAYKSDLRNGGYIDIRGDGLWYATDAGRDYLGSEIPDTPASTEEVVALWGEKLRRGAREMLSVLVRHKGRIVSREELGQAINMESSGGTFSAYLSDLKQAGLIVVDRNGVRANEETLLL